MKMHLSIPDDIGGPMCGTIWHGTRLTIDPTQVTCDTCLRNYRGNTDWYAKMLEARSDEGPMTYAEEFEQLRKMGPKYSSAQVNRMRWLEEQMDVIDRG